MPTDLLTDTAIRKAKPGEKPRKLADGKGLYLELQPSGARWWRLKCRIDGKEKRLSLGVYPEVTLAEARRRRDDARQHIANKVDPSDIRKEAAGRAQRRRRDEQREAEGLPPLDSFEHVAREWLEKVHAPKVSDGYATRSRKQLEADVFPWIGRKAIGDITAPMMLDLLRKIEARGAQDTAHRVKQTCGLVFRYGIALYLSGSLTDGGRRRWSLWAKPGAVGNAQRCPRQARRCGASRIVHKSTAPRTGGTGFGPAHPARAASGL